MKQTRKMTMTAMLVAIGTLSSHLFFIPLGFAKAFPVQHLINVLAAVLLGPYYAVIQALSVSILRNLMGTGSIFAFPGSIVGALLAAVVFRKTGKLVLAVMGEVVGTGLLGALLSYPIAVLILGREAALFGFVPLFIFSSLAGAILGGLLLRVFAKNRVIGYCKKQAEAWQK